MIDGSIKMIILRNKFKMATSKHSNLDYLSHSSIINTENNIMIPNISIHRAIPPSHNEFFFCGIFGHLGGMPTKVSTTSHRRCTKPFNQHSLIEHKILKLLVVNTSILNQHWVIGKSWKRWGSNYELDLLYETSNLSVTMEISLDGLSRKWLQCAAQHLCYPYQLLFCIYHVDYSSGGRSNKAWWGPILAVLKGRGGVRKSSIWVPRPHLPQLHPP